MISFSFFKRFLNVKWIYKKFCCIKMTKIVRSIFGEGKQIKTFNVFNRICSNFVMKMLIKIYKFITHWNIIELKFDAID